MTELVSAWYAWLAQLSQGFILAVQVWIEAFPLPVVSAMLFGLIGASSPCQLTTNLGALAFSAKQSTKSGALTAALAYVSGKVAVYSLVGGLVIVLGVQLQAASIPGVVVARKLLGPLMLIVGLSMLGAISLRGSLGQGWSRNLRAHLPAGSRGGGFLLGVAFSFAFCPTLFWLFFGLTIPLALRSPGGGASQRYLPWGPPFRCSPWPAPSPWGWARPSGSRGDGAGASGHRLGGRRCVRPGRPPRHVRLLVAVMGADRRSGPFQRAPSVGGRPCAPRGALRSVVAAALVLATAGPAAAGSGDPYRDLSLIRPARGEAAPDFTVSGLTSQSITLSGLRGQVVFLNFWATWCPPGREEMPSMSMAPHPRSLAGRGSA